MNNIVMKKCTGTCGEIKEVNILNFEFRNDNQKFRDQCRKCAGKGEPPHIITENNIQYQICTKCNIKKELNSDNYGWEEKENNKYCRKCKICVTEYKAEHYKENKEHVLNRVKTHREKNKERINKKRRKGKKKVIESGIIKKCSGICAKELDLNTSNFSKNKRYIDGFRDQCKKCEGKGVPPKIIVESGIKYQICTGECQLKLEICEDNFYYRKDKNKFEFKCNICYKIYKDKYYIEHRHEIAIKGKEYNSRPEIKKRNNEKTRKRRKESPQLKIRHNISNRIRESIKAVGKKKKDQY